MISNPLTLLLLLFVFFSVSCSKEKTGQAVHIPQGIYLESSKIKSSPLGKWQYGNNQIFEFKGNENNGTWEYYFDYGKKTKIMQFKGNWSVHQFNPETGSGYLKLEYQQIGLASEKAYPFKRFQIVEFYCDQHFFAMNIYRKNDGKKDFLGVWSHANYDWFDDAYFWSESPLWIASDLFENKIMKYIATKEDKKFLEETCYELRAGSYVKNMKLSGADESRLDTIMKQVKSKGGYSGDWFHVPFSSIPGMNPYYVNRMGNFNLKRDGTYAYEQKSPFFVEKNGDMIKNLPNLNKPEVNSDVAVTGNYQIISTPLYTGRGIKAGEEIILKLSNSSKLEIVGDWQFIAVVIKDKNLLLTYPFKKVD